MPRATITAKAVYPPAQGKKFGAVIDMDGNRYQCPPHVVAKVEKGATVTLEYKEEQWGGEPKMVATAVHTEPKPQANGHAPAAGNGNAARDIFVTGIVGRAMGSGQFAVTDIRILTLAAAEAWDALHAPRPAPQHAPQPQDYGDPGYQGDRPSHPNLRPPPPPLPQRFFDDEIPF